MPVVMTLSNDAPHHYIRHQYRASGRLKIVVGVTFLTFLVEIFAGYMTRSVALQADAWHMLTHVFALSLSLAGYVISLRVARIHQSPERIRKLNALTGYTSGVFLALVALGMVFESVRRLLHPETIDFRDALFVAVVGLLVNLVCARLLHEDHSHHHDANMRSAYLHVLADALTSITAILALSLGWCFGWIWLDAVMGIVGSLVISVWCVGLFRQAVGELLL